MSRHEKGNSRAFKVYTSVHSELLLNHFCCLFYFTDPLNLKNFIRHSGFTQEFEFECINGHVCNFLSKDCHEFIKLSGEQNLMSVRFTGVESDAVYSVQSSASSP